MRIATISMTLFVASLTAFGQEYVLPLYTGKIPFSNDKIIEEKVAQEDVTRISNVVTPDIAVYLPARRYATGQAVVICPGGGYRILAYDHEGRDLAKYLNSIGVAGIVLKYRLPVSGNVTEPHKVPLADAQRAIRLVRYVAEKWNINPSKIGIMGSSAGGHLASTLGTHFDYGNKASSDPVEQVSSRPDFMILLYPVISFTAPCTHKGSRDALLGENPSKELLEYYSNELQVKTDTPPAFFVHADDDRGVPVENTLLMYAALRKNNIPAELHIISEGGHGFGLASDNAHVSSWAGSLKLWLQWINKSGVKEDLKK
ncbi:MAG: alpha/beta hydrolase [Bacteroidales bacterium]|nr:alpha/beta hydrolase [Bacteroidales bacterium]